MFATLPSLNPSESGRVVLHVMDTMGHSTGIPVVLLECVEVYWFSNHIYAC